MNAGGGFAAGVSKSRRAAMLISMLEKDNVITKDNTKQCLKELAILYRMILELGFGKFIELACLLCELKRTIFLMSI